MGEGVIINGEMYWFQKKSVQFRCRLGSRGGRFGVWGDGISGDSGLAKLVLSRKGCECSCGCR